MSKTLKHKKRKHKRTLHKKHKHKIHKTRLNKKRKQRKNKNTRRPRKGVKYNQRGGYGRGAGPIGYPWKPCPYTWPGIQTNNTGMTMSNYYPFNPLGISVGGTYTPDSSRLASTNTVQSGGYKGDILLQDMVNGVRDVGHILGGAYNKYMGIEGPISPLPTQDQYKFNQSQFDGGNTIRTPVDIKQIRSDIMNQNNLNQ